MRSAPGAPSSDAADPSDRQHACGRFRNRPQNRRAHHPASRLPLPSRPDAIAHVASAQPVIVTSALMDEVCVMSASGSPRAAQHPQPGRSPAGARCVRADASEQIASSRFERASWHTVAPGSKAFVRAAFAAKRCTRRATSSSDCSPACRLPRWVPGAEHTRSPTASAGGLEPGRRVTWGRPEERLDRTERAA